MNSNLPYTSRPDAVELPVSLQAGVDTLNSRAAIIDELPLRGLGICLDGLLVCWIGLDDGSSSILPSDQSSQTFGGITCISDYIGRVESAVNPSGLAKKRWGSLNFMDIATGQLQSYRKFIPGIYQKGELVSPGELATPIGVLFNYPASVFVGRLPVCPIGPSLEVRSIHSNRCSELWKGCPEAAGERLEDFIDQSLEFPLSKFGQEAREGGLAGDIAGILNTTGNGYEGVIVEEPNQVCDGREPQHIVGHEAVPENLGVMALRASAFGASETVEQSCIRQHIEDCFKLLDDRRSLFFRGGYLIIKIGHWKMCPSCWLGGAGAITPVPPFLLAYLNIPEVYHIQIQKSSCLDRNLLLCGRLEYWYALGGLSLESVYGCHSRLHNRLSGGILC